MQKLLRVVCPDAHVAACVNPHGFNAAFGKGNRVRFREEYARVGVARGVHRRRGCRSRGELTDTKVSPSSCRVRYV